MFELENKPKNVEEAIKAGWRTAEEIYTTANSSKSSWDRFIADVRNSISQKNQIPVVSSMTQLKIVLQEHTILNTITRSRRDALGLVR